MAKLKFVIEMGSSNTVIYQVGYGIVLREPSCIAIKKSTSEVVEVGLKAKKLVGKLDNSIVVIEPIKNGEIVSEPFAKIMLKEFMKKVVKHSPFNRIDATICVSIGLSDNQLLMYKNIAYASGISNVKFENVCYTGIHGCGINKDKTSAMGIINLGGGTCNFAVMSLGQILEGFSFTFGGIDIDKAIIEYIRDAKDLQITEAVAEKIKNECGSLYLHDMTNMEIVGINLTTKRPVNEVITAKEIREIILPYFEKIISGVEKLLCLCSTDIINDISINGLYVVGGLGNITGLENYLSKKLNLPIFVPEAPENCCTIGGSNI